MTYMFILKCALKLVEEIILYYDARSEKHKKKCVFSVRIDKQFHFKLLDCSKKSYTVYQHFTKRSHYVMKSDPIVGNKSVSMSENDLCISYTFPLRDLITSNGHLECTLQWAKLLLKKIMLHSNASTDVEGQSLLRTRYKHPSMYKTLLDVMTILIMKANKMHYFSDLFDKVLHMFQTGPLSIIRSISTLYTQQQIFVILVLLVSASRCQQNQHVLLCIQC